MRLGFPRGHQDLERNAAYYNKLYGSSDSEYKRPWFTHRARTVTWYPALVLAEPPILDLGCGAGQLAAMCQAYGVDYVAGLEVAADAVELARRAAPGSRFELVNADDSDALKGFEFRTAVCLEVLEHVFEDLRLLEAVPVGRKVVASVPNFHTDGHVRWFGSAEQVRQRYGQVLDIERVVEERGATSGNRWFIFKGVRR